MKRYWPVLLFSLLAAVVYADTAPVSLQSILKAAPKATPIGSDTHLTAMKGNTLVYVNATSIKPAVATTTSPGIVKVGNGLAVTADGTLTNTGLAGVASFKGRGGAVVPTTGDYTASMITGLATVGISGSYTDLINQPAIPAAQVPSDWTASSGVARILNKPTVPTALSQLTQDATHRTVTDAEKATWNTSTASVNSVNGQTGTVTLTATDVGADPLGSATSVQTNLNAHTGATNNPHSVTKAQVGLGNVDNTSDANKPISTATQAALDLKANISSLGTAAAKDVPASGNASATQVVMGSDTRLAGDYSGSELKADDVIAKGPIVDVRAFGAKGDWNGSTGADDTLAVNAAATFAASNGKVLRLPKLAGNGYKITDTVNIPAGVSVIMDAPLYFVGNTAVPAVVYGSDSVFNSSVKFDISVIRVSTNWGDTANIVGVKLINCMYATGTIRDVEGFTVGVMAIGSNAPFAYNHISLGNLRDNQYGLKITSSGTDGWANENEWFGGNFFNSSVSLMNVSRYGIWFASEDGVYRSQNANVFHKPCFQLNRTRAGSGEALPVLADGAGMNNRILDARSEGNHTTYVARFVTTGGFTPNRFEFTYTYSDSGTQIDTSQVTGTRAVSSVSIDTNDQKTGGSARKAAKKIWNSGPLYMYATTSAAGTSAPGVFMSSSVPFGNASTARATASPYVTQTTDYLSISTSNPAYIGVMAKITDQSRLIVHRDTVSGYSGRLRVTCFDANGNLLTDDGVSPWVRSWDFAWSGSLYSYGQQTDDSADFILEFRSGVAFAQIFFAKGTTDLRLRSFSIDAVQDGSGGNIAVWPGYTSNGTQTFDAVNLSSTTPALHLENSQNPTTYFVDFVSSYSSSKPFYILAGTIRPLGRSVLWGSSGPQTYVGSYAGIAFTPNVGGTGDPAASHVKGAMLANGNLILSSSAATDTDTGEQLQVKGTVKATGIAGTAITDSTSTSSSTTAASATAVKAAYDLANGKPSLTSTAPNADGIASAGTGVTAARVDHVHPTDTTRAGLDNPTFTTGVTSPLFTSNAADGTHYVQPYNSTAYSGTCSKGMVQTVGTPATLQVCTADGTWGAVTGAVASVNGNTGNITTSQLGAYYPSGTDVAIADGGTGASTAAAALANLGGIGGTVGSTADRIPVAGGTGGSTLKASGASIDPSTGVMKTQEQAGVIGALAIEDGSLAHWAGWTLAGTLTGDYYLALPTSAPSAGQVMVTGTPATKIVDGVSSTVVPVTFTSANTAGTYTPTYTAGTTPYNGVNSFTPGLVHYSRSANEVHVDGFVTADITANAGNATVFYISLPPSATSDLTTVDDCGGVVTSNGVSGSFGGYISADTTGNRARVQYWNTGATGGSMVFSFSFTYTVK